MVITLVVVKLTRLFHTGVTEGCFNLPTHYHSILLIMKGYSFDIQIGDGNQTRVLIQADCKDNAVKLAEAQYGAVARWIHYLGPVGCFG